MLFVVCGSLLIVRCSFFVVVFGVIGCCLLVYLLLRVVRSVVLVVRCWLLVARCSLLVVGCYSWLIV